MFNSNFIPQNSIAFYNIGPLIQFKLRNHFYILEADVISNIYGF